MILTKNRLALASSEAKKVEILAGSSKLQPAIYDSFQINLDNECLFMSLQSKFSEIEGLVGQLGHLNQEISRSIKK